MKNSKRNTMDAPCGVSIWDIEAREFRQNYPNARCSYNCGSCGFNPNEQNRRLEVGKYHEHTLTHVLHDDDGITVADSITKRVRTLHFRRRYDA